MNILLILPILVPFITAILCLFFWGRVHFQERLTVAGMLVLLIIGIALLSDVHENGIQTAQLGSWEAPFGITFVADMLSAIMVTITGLMGLMTALYSVVGMDETRERFGYYPLLNILLMGVCGAFLTGDVFNLYVWFEVMLIASFVLLALGGERAQLEGAIKYVTLNLVSSAIFLMATGILYSVTGTLNMADLHLVVGDVKQPGLVTVLAVMFLVAFGIKAAIFPLFFWLPASYHTPPVAVTTIFSGLLTKVGVYALIRFFTLIFVHDTNYTHTLILIASGFTMVVGVFGAVSQLEMRRLLSFHIVSQIGYLLMGLGIFTAASLAASIFFMVHVIIAKSALFLVSGVVNRLSGTYDLKKLGGLYKASPTLSILFFVPAMALAGIPPLSGFWAKFALVRAGLEAEDYLIVVISLFVSVFTLYSMIKIWSEAFLKKPKVTPGQINFREADWLQMLFPLAVLAGLTLVLGIAVDPVYQLAQEAAEQLMNPTLYVTTVLGGE